MPAKKQALSNALLNLVLNGDAYTAPASVWVALFTVAPTATTDGTEVTGGDYERIEVTFGTSTTATTSNTAAVPFPVATASWGTVTAVAICDADTLGNQLYYGNLTAPKTVGTDDQLNFAAGALTVTEN